MNTYNIYPKKNVFKQINEALQQNKFQTMGKYKDRERDIDRDRDIKLREIEGNMGKYNYEWVCGVFFFGGGRGQRQRGTETRRAVSKREKG